MFTLTDGKLIENFTANTSSASADCVPMLTTTGVDLNGSYTISGCFPSNYYQTVWMSYPVYYCSDKTAKAIEILKILQAEKKIRCDSVPKFIALVEKISSVL